MENQRLMNAITELIQTYAWLNPNAEAIVPQEDQDFAFLNRLWRLQVPGVGGAIAQKSLHMKVREFIRYVRDFDNNPNDPRLQRLNRMITS